MLAHGGEPFQPKFMPITVNLRHLEEKEVQLDGEISAEELDFEGVDELIRVREPLLTSPPRRATSLIMRELINV